MSRFRLKTGRHCERDGQVAKRYKAGDVVKSDKPLDIMFGDKFEKIGRQTAPDTPDTPENTQNTPQVASEEVDPAVDTPEAGSAVVGDSGDAGETTLKAVHRGRGRWDVIKVVNGIETEETINEEFLLKDDAKALAAAGLDDEEG